MSLMIIVSARLRRDTRITRMTRIKKNRENRFLNWPLIHSGAIFTNWLPSAIYYGADDLTNKSPVIKLTANS